MPKGKEKPCRNPRFTQKLSGAVSNSAHDGKNGLSRKGLLDKNCFSKPAYAAKKLPDIAGFYQEAITALSLL